MAITSEPTGVEDAERPEWGPWIQRLEQLADQECDLESFDFLGSAINTELLALAPSGHSELAAGFLRTLGEAAWFETDPDLWSNRLLGAVAVFHAPELQQAFVRVLKKNWLRESYKESDTLGDYNGKRDMQSWYSRYGTIARLILQQDGALPMEWMDILTHSSIAVHPQENTELSAWSAEDDQE